MPNPHSPTIKAICETLSKGQPEEAAAIARCDYPFVPPTSPGRCYIESQCMAVFMRDGFIDRYQELRNIRLLCRLLTTACPAS
jgi:hypothetical protein